MRNPNELRFPRLNIVERLGALGIVAWGVWASCDDWRGWAALTPIDRVLTILLWAFIAATLAFLVLDRTSVRVTRADGLVRRYWGIGVPWRVKECPFSAFTSVELSSWPTHTVVLGGAHFQLQLRGPDRAVTVAWLRGRSAAMRAAACTAYLTGLTLRDTTLGPMVEKTPEQVYEPLVAQLRRMGPKQAAPAPLAAPSKWRPRCVGDEVEYTLPRIGPTWFTLASLGLNFAIVAAICVVCARVAVTGVRALRISIGPPTAAIYAGIVISGLAITFRVAYDAFLRRERVRISSRALTVSQSSPFGTRHLTFPADRLRGVEVWDVRTVGTADWMSLTGTRSHLFVRDDVREISFGAALSLTELHWLRSEICRVLAGEAEGGSATASA